MKAKNEIIGSKQKKYLLRTRYKGLDNIVFNGNKLSAMRKLKENPLFSIDRIGPLHCTNTQSRYELRGYQEILHINGWAVDVLSNDLCAKVIVKIDNDYYRTRYFFPRADVADVFQNSRFRLSGFQLLLPRIFLADGEHKLALIIVRQNGAEYYESHNISLLVSGYTPWTLPAEQQPKGIQRKEDVIAYLYGQLKLKDDLINSQYSSYSWRLSAPLRYCVDWTVYLKRIFGQQNRTLGIYVLRNYGFRSFLTHIRNYLKRRAYSVANESYNDDAYKQFIAFNNITAEKEMQIQQEIKTWTYKPMISIITPVYNVKPKYLERCIQSVSSQYYSNWELILYDDASTNEMTTNYLRRIQGKDPRVEIIFGKSNLHISGASNEALKMATGEFVGLLDHDDELSSDALYEVVKALNSDRSIDFVYSDEDKIDTENKRSGPYFKPDYNPDLLLSNNYITHFAVIRKSIGDKVGWFRQGYEGAQDHDLFLRLIEKTGSIHHIPKVLYHWRQIEGSTALMHGEKSYAERAGIKALTDHMKRNSIQGSVQPGYWKGAYRYMRFPEETPKVSILIPFKDQVELLKGCVDSILEKTNYRNYEIVLINNNSEEKATLQYLERVESRNDNIRILQYNEPFNFSAINNWAAKQVDGDCLLFLNNDTQVIEKTWLNAMIEHITRKEVGAVGAKLLFDDNTIQHAGVLLGINGTAGHYFKGFPGYEYLHHLMGVVRNVSAVTAACMLVRRDLFLSFGGFNEVDFSIAFNDVDFCLRLREKGYLVTYTPYALLYHFESKSRGYEVTEDKKARFARETNALQERWSHVLYNDPYYNPNLTLEKEDLTIKL